MTMGVLIPLTRIPQHSLILLPLHISTVSQLITRSCTVSTGCLTTGRAGQTRAMLLPVLSFPSESSAVERIHLHVYVVPRGGGGHPARHHCPYVRLGVRKVLGLQGIL